MWQTEFPHAYKRGKIILLYIYRSLMFGVPGCWQVPSPTRKATSCACQKCDGQRNGLILLGLGQVVESCECGNEPPTSIKCGEYSWGQEMLHLVRAAIFGFNVVLISSSMAFSFVRAAPNIWSWLHCILIMRHDLASVLQAFTVISEPFPSPVKNIWRALA